jgi:hypothetical protein
MLYQVILVACLDQMIWVRILVHCAFGYDGARRCHWGRLQVVTALSVRREAASRLAYSPTFGYRVGVHAKIKRDWIFSSAGHSP